MTRRAALRLAAAAMAACAWTAVARGDDLLDAEGQRLAALVKTVSPVIVRVRFVLTARQGTEVQRANRIYQGLVVDQKGLVMTLGEVYPRTADRVVGTATIQEPQDIKVIFDDGKEYDAAFVGKDYDLNVGFVRITAPPEGLTTLPLAPKGALAVGQEVTLFGLMPKHYGGRPWFVQTRISAAITEPRELYFTPLQEIRMLGGPVMDAAGRMAGMVAVDTREVRPETDPDGALQRATAAVIVPAWLLAPVIADPPTVRPAGQDGWLGIRMEALTAELAQALGLPVKAGVLVSQVYAGTPAEKGGLKGEDIITAVDGKPVEVAREEDLPEFRKLIVAAGAGTTMTFTVLRGGQTQDLPVTLAATPKSADDAERLKLDDFGAEVREVVFTDTLAPGRKPDLKGVVVVTVEGAGWAGLGGLRAGDLIQQVNSVEVPDLAAFKAQIEAARAATAREVVFFIMRGLETAFIRIEPQW